MIVLLMIIIVVFFVIYNIPVKGQDINKSYKYLEKLIVDTEKDIPRDSIREYKDRSERLIKQCIKRIDNGGNVLENHQRLKDEIIRLKSEYK